MGTPLHLIPSRAPTISEATEHQRRVLDECVSCLVLAYSSAPLHLRGRIERAITRAYAILDIKPL